MSILRTHSSIKKLPDSPGVYFFRRGRNILYIGKATTLRDRVKSYFAADLIKTRGSAILDMVTKSDRVTFQKTDSVLEALILESTLIKKHQPHYNVKEKDDKSFNCVVITDEDFPRVFIVRGRDLDSLRSPLSTFNFKLSTKYGPFPHGAELKEALRLIRKIFPFRDKCAPGQGRPCFNRQIGLCPGICSGEISKDEYRKTILHLKLFFSGRKKSLNAVLLREMNDYAKREEFEKAAKIKRSLFALKHIQDVSLIHRESAEPAATESSRRPFRIEAYDIAHLGGKETVGAMIVMEGGELEKSGYRKFKIKSGRGNDDVANLSEIISRRLSHRDWPLPSLVVVDGGLPQVRAAERLITQANLNIPVVGVVKNERHKAENIVGEVELVDKFREKIIKANEEAHRFAILYHKKLRKAALIK